MNFLEILKSVQQFEQQLSAIVSKKPDNISTNEDYEMVLIGAIVKLTEGTKLGEVVHDPVEDLRKTLIEEKQKRMNSRLRRADLYIEIE